MCGLYSDMNWQFKMNGFYLPFLTLMNNYYCNEYRLCKLDAVFKASFKHYEGYSMSM